MTKDEQHERLLSSLKLPEEFSMLDILHALLVKIEALEAHSALSAVDRTP